MLENLAQRIEHTCLKPEASSEDIRNLCREALENNFYGVCVAGAYVKTAREMLKNSAVKIVSVCGFPHGNMHPNAKRHEMLTLLEEGAHEIDIVLNWGKLKDGKVAEVENELKTLVAAKSSSLLKLIIETSELTDAEKEIACLLAKNTGFDFVKTSTGFASGGATTADIRLMRRSIDPEMGIKASGGVKSWGQAAELIAAGADRFGSSSSLSILKQWKLSNEIA